MSNAMELNSIPRVASSNRFQVNPVQKGQPSNGGSNSNNTPPDEEVNGVETDVFDDKNLLRSGPKPIVMAIKSSLKDKDRLSMRRDTLGDTKPSFAVAQESDDSDNEDDNLLDSDTKYGRSFRHFTREALPRADNYRNILSVTAAYRPSLDELHNATLTNKNYQVTYWEWEQDKPHSAYLRKGSTLHRNGDVEGQQQQNQLKFGWFKGVMMRCLLNIWGVMLFLRLSWVVGQAGIVWGLVLILMTTVVTTITALSMSAISTNGIIKGGGTYYMISRSLGPEFGGSIGLIFSLANAVACAMYVVGFCESMIDLLKSFGVTIVDGGLTDMRIIGSVTIFLLLLIVVIGMEWEAKAQFGLLVILLAAIADFMVGTFVGPKSDLDKAKGFVGYNATILRINTWDEFRTDKGVPHDFFSVFAIFFPAATGILAGANISGDLKDPSYSIPKGTLWAILVTTATYLVMAVMVGATVARDATGDVTDLVNGSWAFLDCANKTCEYGLMNSFQVIELCSLFGPIIYAGCFAATLSSALASLVSAPKVFQALCKDKLYPKIEWFAKGYGKSNEPVRGYILTFFIACAFILIGELNAIAPLISNFFLAAYMLINFSTFHASLAKPVGWRPQFKYYNMWLSLAGAILCVAVMFLISWPTALLTFACVIALYLVVSYRKPEVNWGSTTQAQFYNNALVSVQQLNAIEEHVKNYRPQILVLSGHPNTRPILVNFAYLLTKKTSLLVCGHIIKQTAPYKYRNYLLRRASEWFRRHKVKGFYTHVDDCDFETGAKALMQASGVGKLKPNVLLLGYKMNWMTCDKQEREQYFNVLHKALDMHIAVSILRVGKGLDYSHVLGDDAPKHIMEMPKTLTSNDSSADLLLRDKNGSAHGSCDSLSTRNVSGADNMNENDNENEEKSNNIKKSSSTSDLTVAAGAPGAVSELPDPMDIKTKLLNDVGKSPKKIQNDPSQLYRGPGGSELPKDVLNELTQFTQKRKTGTIDVYWLYDDGGLTLLLPYIINTRRSWSACRLRVFALANRKDDLDFEQRSMAGLLAKFRIEYSALKLLPDITKKPSDSTYKFFDDLVKEFKENEEEGFITQVELMALQDKTNRHLRLREYLLENSKKSDLIVMTLPMPRKNVVSAPLYMAWLEALTRDLPPFLLVRGNHQSVLTFYS